ncbi:pyridoxamine 5'-phosphate oxidase-domain-containing protein [Nemania sp. FL0916]|nr:pyridoxamine 5'-phosphate oxidase-domain-containing protein [Nemania sp. FL0916]
MRFTSTLPILSLAASCTAASTLSPPSTHIFSNPPSTSSSSGHRIPTSYESAILGRRILGLTPLGNLATVFPADGTGDGGYSTAENRPPGLAGMPHALMEYVADCEGSGNPTFLAVDVETSFKNVRDGSNASLAQRWSPPYPPNKRIQSTSTTSSTFFSGLLNWFGLGSEDADAAKKGKGKEAVPYSAANLPRFSLLGYIETIDTSSSPSTAAKLAECFVAKHPDAKYWLPGSRVHKTAFMRLVVEQVYWVGGFGDRAYIGWIPVDEWRRVSVDEWKEAKLPGEKEGWDEWAVSMGGRAAGDL